MSDISILVQSGIIIGDISLVPAKIPAVEFTLQSTIVLKERTILSEFTVLAVGSAAESLNPKGIETGSGILIEGGLLYLKEGKTCIRIDGERQIRKYEGAISMDEGIVQANEKFV
ncbi:MAG: hypothetical protein PHY15_05245 [Eubacteriales bacterium]|nr:hypothetical protein [Eubacteriales bacterium]